jgi:hypothetical protein
METYEYRGYLNRLQKQNEDYLSSWKDPTFTAYQQEVNTFYEHALSMDLAEDVSMLKVLELHEFDNGVFSYQSQDPQLENHVIKEYGLDSKEALYDWYNQWAEKLVKNDEMKAMSQLDGFIGRIINSIRKYCKNTVVIKDTFFNHPFGKNLFQKKPLALRLVKQDLLARNIFNLSTMIREDNNDLKVLFKDVPKIHKDDKRWKYKDKVLNFYRSSNPILKAIEQAKQHTATEFDLLNKFVAIQKYLANGQKKFSKEVTSSSNKSNKVPFDVNSSKDYSILIDTSTRYSAYEEFFHRSNQNTWSDAHQLLREYFIEEFELDEDKLNKIVNPDPHTFYQAYRKYMRNS